MNSERIKLLIMAATIVIDGLVNWLQRRHSDREGRKG
jgi:hypothetical protein